MTPELGPNRIPNWTEFGGQVKVKVKFGTLHKPKPHRKYNSLMRVAAVRIHLKWKVAEDTALCANSGATAIALNVVFELSVSVAQE